MPGARVLAYTPGVSGEPLVLDYVDLSTSSSFRRKTSEDEQEVVARHFLLQAVPGDRTDLGIESLVRCLYRRPGFEDFSRSMLERILQEGILRNHREGALLRPVDLDQVVHIMSGGIARFSLESEDSFSFWTFPEDVVPDVLLEWLARVRAGLVAPAELLRTGACIPGHDLQCRGLDGEMRYVKHLETRGLYYTSMGSKKRWHCFVVDADCFTLTYSIQHRGNRDAQTKSTARELQMTPDISLAETMKKRVRTLMGLQSLPWPSFGAQFLNQQAKDFLSQQKVVRLPKGSVLLGSGKVPFRAVRLLAGSVAISVKMSRGHGLPPRPTTIGVIEEGGWIGALGCRDLTKLPFNFVVTRRRDCYGMVLDAKEFRKHLMPLLPEGFWIQEQEFAAAWRKALEESKGRVGAGFDLADLQPEKGRRHYGVEVPRECLMQCAPDILQHHRPKPPPEAPRWRMGALRHHGAPIEGLCPESVTSSSSATAARAAGAAGAAAGATAGAAAASSSISSAAAPSSSAASMTMSMSPGELPSGEGGRRVSIAGDPEFGKRRSSLMQLLEDDGSSIKVLGNRRNFVKPVKIFRPVYHPATGEGEFDDHVLPLTDWLYAGTFEGRQREMELRKRAERRELRARSGTGGGGRARWRRQNLRKKQQQLQQHLPGEGQASTDDGGHDEALSSVAGDDGLDFDDDFDEDDETPMSMSAVTSLQSGVSAMDLRRHKGASQKTGSHSPISSSEDAEFARQRQGDDDEIHVLEDGEFVTPAHSEKAHFRALAEHLSTTLDISENQHRRGSECGVRPKRGSRHSQSQSRGGGGGDPDEDADEGPGAEHGGGRGESRVSRSSSSATDARASGSASPPGTGTGTGTGTNTGARPSSSSATAALADAAATTAAEADADADADADAEADAAAAARLALIRRGRVAQPLPTWPPFQDTSTGGETSAWTPPSNFRPSTPKPLATTFVAKLKRPLSGGASLVPRQHRAGHQAATRPPPRSAENDFLKIKGSALLDD